MPPEDKSLDTDSQSYVNSSSLEVSPQLPPSQGRGSAFSLLRLNHTALLITAAALISIVLVGVASLIVGGNRNNLSGNNGSPTSSYSVTDQPDQQLSGLDLKVSPADTLSVNGMLQANGGLVITPSDRPASPVQGQLYFDKSTNQPYFYNGTEYIGLEPSLPDLVNSVGGVSGALSLGTGLRLSGNTLSVTGLPTQQAAASFSLADLAQGSNIAITGNSGVATIATVANPVFGGLLKANGGLIVANGTTLTNNGASLNTAINLGDFPSGGSIGAAAATVDGATSFTINQTTAGQILSLPTPTDATAGRLVYILNTGSQSFVIAGVTVGPGNNSSFLWNGSNWTSTAVSTGVSLVGALDGGVANANGASISGNTIYLQSASSLNPGLVNTGAQTFAGNKTFSGSLSVQSGGGITIGVAGSTAGVLNLANGSNANLSSLQAAAPSGAGAATYTLPSIAGGSSATFCLSTGNCSSSGSAGGDLTGNYPNPTIAKLQGTTLSISGLGSAQILQYNGTAWVNQTISGDITISNSGVATIGAGKVTNADLANSSVSVTAGSGLTGGGAVSLGSSTTLNVAYGSAANTATQGNTTLVCASGTGNLSGGGNTITLGSGGSCSGITIVNNPSFSGGVTVGSTSSNGALSFLDGTADGFSATLQLAGALGANKTYNLPITGGTICLNTGNCAGAGGGVTTVGGTSGDFAVFTGSQTIGNSGSLSESGVTLTASGNLVVQGANSITIGVSTTNTGSLLFKNSTNGNTLTLQSGASGSNFTLTLPTTKGNNGDCLESDGSGNLSFASCTGGAGGGVTSLDSQIGVLSLANSSGSGGTITIDNAKADGSTKGIATFNSTNFSDNGSGVINLVQNINSTATPTFGGVVLGSSTVNGTLQLFDGTADGFSATLQLAGALGANQSYLLPTSGGTICLQGSSSCGFATGSGAAVTAIGALDGGVANANGASISGNTLYLQSASATNPGLVNTGSQTFAGAKTFQSASATALVVQNASNNILTIDTTGNGNLTVGNASNPSTITFIGGATGSRPASPTKGQLYFDTTTNQLIQYNGSKWVSDARTATKIVAASNSTQAEKDAADYVASGTNDGATINSALSALPAAGGTVYLEEGTYDLGATTINMPNNATLTGSGSGTLLTYPTNVGSLSYFAISNSDSATGTNITIQNLVLDGNQANQSAGTFDGIFLNGMGGGSGSSARPGAKIINVVVKNEQNYGMYVLNSSNNTFTSLTLLNNGYEGMYLSSTSNNNLITDCTIQGNGGNGLEISSSNYDTVNNNTVQGNTSIGIAISGSASDNTVSGNTLQNNGAYGIDNYSNGSHNTVNDNTIVSSNQNGLYINGSFYSTYTGNNIRSIGTYAIYLRAAAYNTVSDNKVVDSGSNTANNGIYMDSASTKNSIVANDIKDTSCTTTCYAINISDAGSTGNYLSGNHFLGDGTHLATINDATTSGNTYSGEQLSENGDALFRNAANSATAFQVQNASGTPLLTEDTQNQQLTVRGGSDTSTGTATINTSVGTEDFPTANWVSTGWTTAANSATHSTGNTSALTTTWTPTIGSSYLVSYSYTNCTSTNTLFITAGGVTLNNATDCSSNNTIAFTATTTQPLSFQPSSSYNGKVSNVTVSPFTPASSALTVQNSSGTTSLQVLSNASNTYIGSSSGQNSTTASGNIALGTYALQETTTGGFNVAVGQHSLQDNTTGYNNTALGYSSLSSNITGTWDTAIGYLSLNSNTTGGSNTALGGWALLNNTTGNDNTALGAEALQNNTTGSNNIAVGPQTLVNNTTGSSNVGVGSLYHNTTGANNTATGVGALNSSSTGSNNVSDGYNSLLYSLSGSNNTALGYQALYNSVNTMSSFGGIVGGSGYTNGTYNNVTLSYSSGQFPVAFPVANITVAGGAVTGVSLVSGGLGESSTTVFTAPAASIGGTGSGFTVAAGTIVNNNNDSALGYYAGFSNTSGSNNTYLGYQAGYIDSGSGFSTIGNLQNATSIGAYSQVTQNNSLILGSVDTPTSIGIGITSPTNFLSVSPLDYQAGTATRTNGSATLVGTGTTWTSAMIGDIIVFADGTTNTVSGFTDASHITMSTTYSGTTDSSPVHYRFHHVGLQVTSAGNAYVQNSSSTAFQVLNAGGTSALTVDTTNLRVNIGTIGTPTGQLYVSGLVPTAVAGSVAASSSPNSVFVQGRYAYLTLSGTNEIAVYDVSNPSAPVNTGNVGSSGSSPASIYVQGRYAYAANIASGTIGVYDISNPSSPTLAGSGGGSLGFVGSIYVQGRYLYAAAASVNKLWVLDISNPTTPTTVGSISTTTQPGKVVVQGRYAFVANSGGNSLQIYDVSNPSSPSSAGSVATTQSPNDVYVQGRYAYVAEGTTTPVLQIFDISNPASPVSVGSLTTSQSPESIYVQGRYAYLSIKGAGGLQIVDVSNPATPSNVGTLTGFLGTGANSSIYVQGRYAYFADQGNNLLQTVDLGGEYSQNLSAGSFEANGLQVDNNSKFFGDLGVQGGLSVGSNSEINGNLGVSGTVMLQNAANSTAALQVANSAGSVLLNTDTTNSRIGTGTISVPSGLSATAAAGVSFLGASTTYYFKVTAVDAAGGETPPAATEVSATTDATCPGSGNCLINLTWAAPSGAVGYKVYYSTSPGTEANYFTSTTNSYTFSSASGVGGTPPSTNSAYVNELTGNASGTNYLTNTTIKAPSSTTAFQVQSASGNSYLTVDTTNNKVTLGSGAGTAATLLVLGTKTDAGDPGTCTNGGIYYNSNSNQFRACQNGTWQKLISAVSINCYVPTGVSYGSCTAGNSSSWTAPAGITAVEVIAVGAGGGGGGGASGAASSRGGGGGGGGGAYATAMFSAADVGSSVTVSPGQAGTSGSATNPGGVGGNSSFGTDLTAYGGGSGGAGTNTAGSGGVGGGGGGTAGAGSSASVNGGMPQLGSAANNGNTLAGAGAGGGAASNNGSNAEYGGAGGGGGATANSATGVGGSSLHGAGAGGGGGYCSLANAGADGGAGGIGGSYTAGGGGTAGSTGAGGAGTNGSTIIAGSGGGGGGTNTGALCVAGTGGAGGNGAIPGGGGGGGAAGATAGAGGTGGAGVVWVIAW